MEVASLLSFTSSPLSSLPSVVPSPQNLNHRGLFFLPVSSRRFNVGISSKSLRLCPKACLRGDVEATAVPTSVPVRVAHELLQAGHRYLDVRTPEEFSAGHVSGAVNVPYLYRVGSGMARNPEFLKEVSVHFGKYDELIVGCELGKRSLMAATDLLAAFAPESTSSVLLSWVWMYKRKGYTGVTDMAGGYAAWRQTGLPSEL